MAKQLDFSAAWRDTNSLWRANREMSLAVGGCFFLLPALLLGWFGAELKLDAVETVPAMSAALSEWLGANWYWLLLSMLMGMVGTLALYLLVLDAKRPTVGEALAAALSLVPAYMLLQLMTGWALFFGFLLFIIPCFYLAIKLLFAPLALSVEHARNPVRAMARSWALTKNNSIVIFIFLLMIGVAAFIGLIALQLVIGIPLTLLLSPEISKPLLILLNCSLQTIVSLFMMFAIMAIYRQLASEA